MSLAQHRVEWTHQLLRVVDQVSVHQVWSYILRIVHLFVARAGVDVGGDRVGVHHGDL